MTSIKSRNVTVENKDEKTEGERERKDKKSVEDNMNQSDGKKVKTLTEK